ncbi:MAG: agmatinase [Ilumatobacteraceae bacterium]
MPTEGTDEKTPHDLGMTWAGECTFARFPMLQPGSAAKLAVQGVAYDLGVTNRPGSRFGPRAVREQSTLSGEFPDVLWPWAEGSLPECADAGDVPFPPGSTDLMLEATTRRTGALIAAGLGVVSIGGDHLVTLPLLRAHAEHYGQMALVHFDAHCDTWEYNPDAPLHHGMMFLKAAREGLIDPAHSVQIGMRTPNDTMGFNVFDMNRVVDMTVQQLADTVHELTGGMPIYLTIDIDALDPAFAPATGTPVIGGLTTAQLRGVLFRLAGLDVVGADLVEVAPHYEGPAQITALAGATLAHDELHLLAAAPRRG